VNVAIFLKLGRLAPWTDVSDDHGILLTSADEDAFLVNHSTPSSAQHYMECTTNGNKVAEEKLPKTIPIQFSLGEGMDIGMDVGSPVDFNYKLPFRFTGKIEKVMIDLK
jgi:hypothetical protein